MQDQKGDMRRHFTLEAFRGRGTAVTMSFDASPWGAGRRVDVVVLDQVHGR